MTCIVGLIDNGKVYIGGDSAGANYALQQTIRKDPKVFRVGEFIIGFTTSFRMGQLLMYNFEAPKIEDDNLYRYMIQKFIPAVRDCFKAGGFGSIINGEEKGGFFLVGIRGKLFEIESDFQVGESYDDYISCGCGDDLAQGSLFTTKDMNMSPIDRINRALEAAAHHSAGVAGPFVVLGEEEKTSTQELTAAIAKSQSAVDELKKLVEEKQ